MLAIVTGLTGVGKSTVFERPEVLVEGGVSPGAISGWYV
jgi:adenylate kinase